MRHRTPETFADYLVVAICPALIMLLVGSLMWFLVEVFYQGEFKGRLLWVMAMFVIAIVGIARIAMEEGLAYASLFGGALAGAIALALNVLVKDGLLIGAPIMALVWWAAHKLTWDCTVIDNQKDVSGQGLLQHMGLDPAAGTASASPPGTSSHQAELEATTAAGEQPSPPWWERMLEPDRRPHAPGVWVVYFSLAALPLFGLGGWFVPASDPVRRARVFGLLVIYVASGMGLLLATSFLGLRRYLRQRKLEMPVEMTTTWILAGLVMIFAMLITAAILPRPRREYSLSQLPFTVTSAVRRASRIAFGKDGTKDDAAQDPSKSDAKDAQTTDRQGGRTKSKQSSDSSDSSQQQKSDQGNNGNKGEGKGKSGDQSSKSQSSSGGKGDSKGGKSQSGNSKGNGKSKERSAESQSRDQSNDKADRGKSENEQSKADQQQQNQSPENEANQPQSESGQPPPSPGRSAASQTISQVTSLASKAVFTLLQGLFYVGLIVACLIAAWIYREELKAAWQKLLDELRDFWSWLFGKKQTAAEAPAVNPAKPPPLPFAAFADPFLNGDAGRMSWPRLVRYTFDAVEAWGRERGCPRTTGQTPQEFALALADAEPRIAGQLQTLTAWYNQLAYAPRAQTAGSPESLRELWRSLRSGRADVAA